VFFDGAEGLEPWAAMRRHSGYHVRVLMFSKVALRRHWHCMSGQEALLVSVYDPFAPRA